MAGSKIVITAGLERQETINTITTDLQSVKEALNTSRALEIVCHIDNKSIDTLKSELQQLSSRLNVTIPNISIDSQTKNNATTMFNSMNQSLVETKSNIQTVEQSLANLPEKYAKAIKTINMKDLKNKGIVNPEASMAKIKNVLSSLGDVTLEGKYDDRNSKNGLYKVIATVKAANGEIRTFNYLLNDSANKFELISASYSDKGMSKAQKDMEKYSAEVSKLTSEFENLKSKYSAISTGLTQPFEAAQKAFDNLGNGKGSLENVREALANINTEANKIGANLGSKDKSFNVFENAVNNARNFDNVLKSIEIDINGLGNSSNKNALTSQLDDAKTQLKELQRLQNTVGTNEQWSKQYDIVNTLIKDINNNLKITRKIEAEDASSATQKTLDNLHKIKEAYVAIAKYTKVIENPNTSDAQKSTASAYLLNYQKKIKLAERNLQQEGLLTNEVKAQIKEYQRLFVEVQKNAQAKARGVQEQQAENAQLAKQSELLNEIKTAYSQINSYEQKGGNAGTATSAIYEREVQNLQEKIRLTTEELKNRGLLTTEIQNQINAYEQELQVARDIRTAQEQDKTAQLNQERAEAFTTLSNRINTASAALEAWGNRNKKAINSNKLMSDGITTFSQKWAELSTRMSELQAKMQSGNFTEADAAQFKHLTEEVATYRREADAARLTTSSLFQSMKTQLGYVLMQWISLRGAIRVIRSLVNEITTLDTAMTELRKVTDATEEEFNDFSKSAAKIAKDLGATISDVINATATFSRAGFNLQDATELGRVATLFKNVGEGISIDKASESIISVMKAFNIEASEAERIIDRINHVSNNFAIDSQGLGFALQRVASAMRAANNTLDETIALTTVANEIVQNPEMVAQGWRTVALRIRGAKTELEEAGEDTEGMVESTAKLRDLIKGISGVDIMLDENTFKSTYQIIEELGKVWSSISDVNQASLLEAIAGKRQSNIVAAALTNYERLDDVLDKSVNSFGSARKEQEKYERSVQYSIDTLKAAYQEFAQTAVNNESVKKFLSAIQTIIEGLTVIVDKLGSIPTLLAAISMALSFKKFGVFGTVSDQVNQSTRHLTIFGKQLTQIRADLQNPNTTGFAKVGAVLDTVKIKALAAQVGVSLLNAALTAGLSLLLTAVISGVASYVDELVITEEELDEVRESAVETTKSLKESANTFIEEAESLDELVNKYKEIILTVGQTSESKAELVNIQQQIVDKYGEEAEGIDLVNGKYDEQIAKIDELSQKQYEQWKREHAAEIKEAQKIANYNVGWAEQNEQGRYDTNAENYDFDQVFLKGWVDHSDKLAASLYVVEDVSEDIEKIWKKIDGVEFVDGIFSNDVFLSGRVSDARDQIGQLIDIYSEFEDADEDTLKKLTDHYNKLNEALANTEEYMSEINSYETANQEAQQLKEYENRLAEIQNEIAEKNIDINKTIFGNIDTNSRQLLTWTKENLRKYSEAISSWGFTQEELANSVSTVMGSSSEYDGIEIAFSPILQTDDGAVLLSKNTVDKYIWGLIEKAGEGWTNEQLLTLDTEGLEIDGQKVKNLLADIGDTAIATGEAMHYVGNNGALAMAENDLKRFKRGIYDISTESIKVLKGITVSLREEWFTALTEAQNGVTKTVDAVTSALQTLANGDGLSSADFWKLMELDTDKIITDISMVGDKYVLSQEQLIKLKDQYINKQIESLEIANEELATKRKELATTIEQAKAELSVVGARGMSNSTYREEYKAASDAIKQGEKNLAEYDEQVRRNNILLNEWKNKLGDVVDYTEAATQKQKALNDEIKRLNDEIKDLNNEVDARLKAQEHVIDDIISGHEDELAVLENEKAALEEELEALNEQKSTIEEIIENYDTVNSLVQKTLDKEVDALEEQKKAIEDTYNKRIEALKAENEEREDALEYAQKLADLENARNNKRRVRDETRGWRYESVREDVVKAENSLADYENSRTVKALEKERDAQAEAIDNIIKEKEKYADLWKNISEEIQTEEDELLAEEILGADWREKIANGDIEIMEKFRTEYRNHNIELKRITDSEIKLKEAAIKAKDAEIKSKQEQIKVWQDYKTEIQNAVKDAKESQEDYIKYLDDVKINENSNLTERGNNLESFKNRINGIMDDIGTKQGIVDGLTAALDGISGGDYEYNLAVNGLDDLKQAAAASAVVATTAGMVSSGTMLGGVAAGVGAAAMGGMFNQTANDIVDAINQIMSSINGYSSGGVNDKTGIAMLHGTKQKSEVIFNAKDAAKLYEYVHSTPNLVTSMLHQTKLNGLSDLAKTNNTSNNSVNINSINVYANNPSELSRGLDKEIDQYFQNKLTQNYTKR